MQQKLETKRLILEPLAGEHFPLVASLYSDPLVTVGWGAAPYDERDLRFAWRAMIDAPDRKFGHFAIRVKESDELVGVVGVRPGHRRREAELGYMLLPSAWGEGFAAEAAKACTEWAFGQLSFDQVTARGISNSRSISVVTSLAFSELPRTARGDVRSFGVTREAWWGLDPSRGVD